MSGFATIVYRDTLKIYASTIDILHQLLATGVHLQRQILRFADSAETSLGKSRPVG
jgi:hypothetical protein